MQSPHADQMQSSPADQILAPSADQMLGSPAFFSYADKMLGSPADQMHQLPFSEEEDSTEDKQNKNKGRAELY